ncbi:MAG: hypothetical protein JW936_06480 [Sedimentisphaerales bacterium]|nr:hypothetical protein [Sedimentisphaerales bacterium]
MNLSFKRAERLSLVAFLLHGLFFMLALWVGNAVGSLAVRVEAWHFLGGSIIWLILLLQFRQRRMAQEEHRDVEQYNQLRRQGKDTSVFESSSVEGSLHIAQRRLVWMEKYLIPIFAILTVVYLVGIGLWKYYWVRAVDYNMLIDQRDAVLSAAAYIAGFALVSFLFSRYAVGMSQQEQWRPLRAGGSYLLSNALICFATTVALLVADGGYPLFERVLAYVIAAVMIVIGIEVILNLVLDAYRPRVKGVYHRAPYESRILGLFSEPGGIFRTAAHALDYQFGFKVSDTWFFQLLSRAVVPLLIAMTLVLYLMTTLAIVEPGNVGVLERFGEPLNAASPYEPGLHLKYPWPIDRIRSFPMKQLQTLEIGFESFERREDNRPVLWSVQHWKNEYPFMVAVIQEDSDAVTPADVVDVADACDVAYEGLVPESLAMEDDSEAFTSDSGTNFDLLIIALSVHYLIEDVEQYAYADNGSCYRDTRSLLEGICYRQAIRYAAHSDIQTLMGPGRYETTQFLEQAIQAEVERYGLGIKVVFVGLDSVHPHLQVAPSFETVISAFQNRQAVVLTAQGESSETLAFAESASDIRLARAQAYAERRSLTTQAISERFRQQCLAYELGGNVYLMREYLSVLDEYLPAMRKYVFIADNVDSWVYELDLQEKLQPDLFSGLGLPEQENSQ